MYSHTSEAVKYFCVLYSRCRTNAIADQKSPTVIYCDDSPAWQKSRVLLMQLVLVVGNRISLVKGTRNQPKVFPFLEAAVFPGCPSLLPPFSEPSQVLQKLLQPEIASPHLLSVSLLLLVLLRLGFFSDDAGQC